MILLWLIIIPMAGACAAWWVERRGPQWPRWTVLVCLGAELALAGVLWLDAVHATPLSRPGTWVAEWNGSWIPSWGIRLHVAADGLSLSLLLLTAFLGIMAVVCSWTEIRDRVGFFHFNLLWTLTGVIGVFLAMDLFLFFLFWEVMLIPMYLLIILWGHEGRLRAGYKFVLFTQAGSLLLLIAIIALAFIQAAQKGIWSFDYQDLLAIQMSGAAGTWLMLGFFLAFAVKLPMFPFHTWLPDAHTEAPTAGSVILAGLLLKTGAYGLIRFAVPLFPEASREFAPVAMFLGVVGILYGAMLAFAQTDLKRLVAYSSVSHLGFVLLGVYAGTHPAFEGAVMQMIAHGISTGALFMLVGVLQERLHTRDLRHMGGLWRQIPVFSSLLLFFAVASLGMPGFGNFIGEFLVLLGSFSPHAVLTVAATAGIVVAAVYALAMVQHTVHGQPEPDRRVVDLSQPMQWSLISMAVILVWLGLYPQPLLRMLGPATGIEQPRVVSAERGSG
ncbi:NADH-quinone oxidoreductase subunit M [Nitrospira sp. Nam80]